MNELFSMVGLAVVGGVMAMTVRSINAPLGTVVALAVGCAVVISLLDDMSTVVDEIKVIIQSGGLDNRYIESVVKVIGIAYVTQFGADMLRDGGESAIASKCELAGKIFILCLTLPIIGEFLEICMRAVEGI